MHGPEMPLVPEREYEGHFIAEMAVVEAFTVRPIAYAFVER
jgi:hypothetical protein